LETETQTTKGKQMKTIIAIITLAFASASAFAAAEMKEVCHDKVGKDGKPVMKDGKPVQECKKIKVHKKVEGDKVPEPKK
jgi:hypothetical protein